jgi:hypothetical protein
MLHYCSVSGPTTSDALVAGISIDDLGEAAALGNDTPVPKQMNGAVSRTRLGINRWPLFGYYFAPVWGTIALMARPGKPQFYSGRILSESSNPSPSTGESRANLKLAPGDKRDRGFESASLQQRVDCEPDAIGPDPETAAAEPVIAAAERLTKAVGDDTTGDRQRAVFDLNWRAGI